MRTNGVNSDRTLRHRATRVRRGDGRPAGLYEQCVDEVESFGSQGSFARSVGTLAGLEVGGLVGRPGRVTLTDLRYLAGGAEISAFDCSRVDAIDLLVHVRAAAECDLIVLNTLDDGEIVLPFDVVLRDGAAHLELGKSHSVRGRDWRAPISFHCDSLAGKCPVDIVGLRAITFAGDVAGTP